MSLEEPGVVRLRGEVDLSSAPRLTAAVAVAGVRWPRLVVDLAGVTFLDVGAARLLASLSSRQPDVVLKDPPPQVARVLQLVGDEGSGEVR